ncbi:MAG TPA: tetratricopeptide repeat protein, partial [Polyangia bacterium]
MHRPSRARRRARPAGYVVVALALALLGAGHAAQAQPRAADPKPAADPKHKAARLVDEGVAHFNAGRHDTALAWFRAAYEVYPSPKIHLNIGEALRKLGRHAAAAEAYDRFLVETAGAPEVKSERRRRAELALGELIRRLGRLLLPALPPGATVTVDDEPRRPRPGRPLYVAPGAHRVGAAAPGHVAATVTVEAAADEERPVPLVLARVAPRPPAVAPPPPRPLRWTWVGAGATGGLAAGGIVMAVRGGAAGGERDATIGKALLISAGATALGTVLIYYLLERPRRLEPR